MRGASSSYLVSVTLCASLLPKECGRAGHPLAGTYAFMLLSGHHSDALRQADQPIGLCFEPGNHIPRLIPHFRQSEEDTCHLLSLYFQRQKGKADRWMYHCMRYSNCVVYKIQELDLLSFSR